MRIAFMGGVPPAMGGGGLERQLEHTAAALRAIGHEVVRPECVSAADGFDVLHAFRAELQLYELLGHWRRNRTPMVVSPVLGVSERERRRLRVSARVPGLVTSARMRREVFLQADALVALSEDERHVLHRVFGVPQNAVERIPNGVDDVEPVVPAEAAALQEPFLLMVGHVNARKGQAAVLRAVAGEFVVVIAGGLAGAEEERREFRRLVEGSRCLWLGDVAEPAVVRGLQTAATATALLSEAEGLPLVVLESLAAGTPVIASDLPVHRELAEAHPGWVTVVRRASDVPRVFERLVAGPPPGARPLVPTWHEVARRLVPLYERVIEAR